MSYVLTYPAKDGGFESKAVLELPDGKLLSNHLVDRCAIDRDLLHAQQIVNIRIATGLNAERDEYLKDPSSLDRSNKTEATKDFIRRAPWLA